MILRKWVDVVLIIIQFSLMFLLSGECKNDLYFIVSKLVEVTLFMINNYILFKYSRIFKDEF